MLVSGSSGSEGVGIGTKQWIRSLDESSRLDQSETVKVARAVKQKNIKNWGSAPEILLAFYLISSKMNLKTDGPP